MHILIFFKQLFSFSVKRAILFMLIIPAVTFMLTAILIYRHLQHSEVSVVFTNYAGSLRLITSQIQMSTHLVCEMGQEAEKISIQEQTTHLDTTLRILTQGGRLDGNILPPAPENVQESLNLLNQIWYDIENELQFVIEMPSDNYQVIETFSSIKSSLPVLIKYSNKLVQDYQYADQKMFSYLVNILSVFFLINIGFLLVGITVILRYLDENHKNLKNLEEAEEKYRSIFENVDEGLYQTTTEGEMLIINPGMAMIFGYDSTREMLTEVPTIKSLHVNPIRYSEFTKLLAKEKTVTGFVSQFHKKDGNLIWVSESAHQQINDNGNVIGFEGLLTETTDLVLAQQALEKSEARFKRIIESAPDGMIITNQKGEIVQVNQQTDKLFGYKREELIGQQLEVLIPARFKNHVEFRRSFFSDPQTRHMASGLRMFGLRKDGSEFPIDASLSHFDSPDGIMGSTSVRDRTEIIEAEKALKEEEDLNRLILDNVEEIIYVVMFDEEDPVPGEVKFVSQRSESIIGYTYKEFIETPNLWVDLVHPEDQPMFINTTKEIISQGGASIREYRFKHKNGEYRWFSDHVVPQRDKGVTTGFFGVARDITDQVKARHNLETSLTETKRANEVKDKFIANISHEIRTPLNSIIGFSELIADQFKELINNENKIFFDSIARSGSRLIHTVHQILEISQYEAETYKGSIEIVDVVQIVKNVSQELEILAKEKNLSLEIDSAELYAYTTADEYSLSQALINIIDNAVKYTDSGGIYITLDSDQNGYILKIKDTGIGMSEEYQKKIFDPYTQESEGYTKRFQGLGLGMALCKRYLDYNDAKLEINSKPGEGTEMILYFNRADETKEDR